MSQEKPIIIQHKDYITMQLECKLRDEDALIAFCMQNNLLDATKHYRLIFLEMFDQKLFIVAKSQKELKTKSLAEVFLPFGLDDHALDCVLFCFMDFLVAFYQQKILYFQEYKSVSDLFVALEVIQSQFCITIKTIYSSRQFKNISGYFFKSLDSQRISQLFLTCKKQYPQLFFSGRRHFFDLFFNTKILILFFLFFSIFGGIFLTNFYLKNLQKQITQLQKEVYLPQEQIQYQPRYPLFTQIFTLGRSLNIHLEAFDFFSQDKENFIFFQACNLQKNRLLQWIDSVDIILATSFFSQKISESFSFKFPYYCVDIAWQN